ncbi:MAG: hydroxyisourate hydrolase [Chitinophagaceae bacterium]
MSQITSHVLDTSKGSPASGIMVVLYEWNNNDWREINSKITSNDGRVTDLLNADLIVKTGIYKLKFNTREYFEKLSIRTFYPFIEIAFEITNEEHHHVPLLLNPFGYSTYRGS